MAEGVQPEDSVAEGVHLFDDLKTLLHSIQ